MKTDSVYLHDIKITVLELDLILALRSKFKGCEFCMDRFRKYVLSLEKKHES